MELTVYYPPHSHLLEVTCDPSQLVIGQFGSTCPLGTNVGEHRMCTLTGNMVRCGRFGEKDNLREQPTQTPEKSGDLDWLFN